MDPLAGLWAVSAGLIGAQATRALMEAAGETSDAMLAAPSLTQLGVTAVCIVVGYFMLRRSDGRDRVSQAAEDKAQAVALETLQAQLVASERRAEQERLARERAEKRADLAHERLIALFTNERTEQA